MSEETKATRPEDGIDFMRAEELAKLETENTSLRERVAQQDDKIRKLTTERGLLNETLMNMEMTIRCLIAFSLNVDSAEHLLPPALNFMATLCARQGTQLAQMKSVLARVELERAAAAVPPDQNPES